jgi:hypothetical protein
LIEKRRIKTPPLRRACAACEDVTTTSVSAEVVRRIKEGGFEDLKPFPLMLAPKLVPSLKLRRHAISIGAMLTPELQHRRRGEIERGDFENRSNLLQIPHHSFISQLKFEF